MGTSNMAVGIYLEFLASIKYKALLHLYQYGFCSVYLTKAMGMGNTFLLVCFKIKQIDQNAEERNKK